MREESLEQFEPVVLSPALPADSNMAALHDDAEGLAIVLTAPEGASFRIRFRMRLAYRVTDEGDRLRSMEYLDGRAATPTGRIKNSSWLRWFIAETLDIRKGDPLTHWCVVTPNDIVDVLSMEVPVVERISGNA